MDRRTKRTSVLLLVLVLADVGCASQARNTPSPGAIFTPTTPPTAGATSPATSAGVSSFAGDPAWVAYQTNRSAGLWLVHPDGTDDHEIATDVPGEHLHPDWSPDGSRLLFTSRGDHDVLFELTLDSGKSRRLWECVDPCLGDDEAVYAPDGDRIAFVRAVGPVTDGLPADCSLWLGDPATGAVERLTSTPGCQHRETFPHWSRDGSALAYYRGVYDSAGATTATTLHVLDVASRKERQLLGDDVFAGDSDWSVGDEWLLFSTHPLNDFQCCVVSNLYRVHPDGTGLEQLTRNESADLRATQPRYTPDGRWITFTAVTPTSRSLWAIPAAGGDPVVLAPGGIYTHGTWQPGVGG